MANVRGRSPRDECLQIFELLATSDNQVLHFVEIFHITIFVIVGFDLCEDLRSGGAVGYFDGQLDEVPVQGE